MSLSDQAIANIRYWVRGYSFHQTCGEGLREPARSAFSWLDPADYKCWRRVAPACAWHVLARLQRISDCGLVRLDGGADIFVRQRVHVRDDHARAAGDDAGAEVGGGDAG